MPAHFFYSHSSADPFIYDSSSKRSLFGKGLIKPFPQISSDYSAHMAQYFSRVFHQHRTDFFFPKDVGIS